MGRVSCVSIRGRCSACRHRSCRLRGRSARGTCTGPDCTKLDRALHRRSCRRRLAKLLVRIIQRSKRLQRIGTLPGSSALGAVGSSWIQLAVCARLVVGVEGDISWTSLADLRGGPALGPNGVLAGPNASVMLNANTQWLASARSSPVNISFGIDRAGLM
jgi:hypothetical protein